MNATVHLTKFPVHLALARIPQHSHSAHELLLDSPTFRHRAVMGLFDENLESSNPRSKNNILFRLDSVPGHAPYFLVQSSIPVQAEDIIKELETKEVPLQSPQEGTPVAFRLAINGIIRKSRSREVSPVPFDGESQENPLSFTHWLEQRLSGALKDISVMNHQRQVLGTDHTGKKQGDLTVQIDTVDGFAYVDSPSVLEQALLNGVGRAKSYGCGMLSIKIAQ
ncbi:type I-E CRISPR-associated protein Cas6/Cse3/CasE [Rothia sp. P13129]|uniref:type I-E CRISPR-associated protein Cas6/Cse3/CasE n=1 Tax=Rothia sp. P13129 TaxID=3402664 RepID=UPI003AC7C5DC